MAATNYLGFHRYGKGEERMTGWTKWERRRMRKGEDVDVGSRKMQGCEQHSAVEGVKRR